MARKKPDTVKSATPGFQALLGRGELPAGTKTAGDLARERSDATRYGYQPSSTPAAAPARAKPGGGGGGAQPTRTRASSPTSLPKRAPLPPPRPGMQPKAGPMNPVGPINPGMPAPDTPFPMGDAMAGGYPDNTPMAPVAGVPNWSLGDPGFGGGPNTDLANLPPLPRTPNPMATMPSPQLSQTALAGGLPTPGMFQGDSAMAATPPAGNPMTAGPTMPPGPAPLSNMPTMPGATPPLPPGLLDSLKQLFGGQR